ncbi:MAG TPA: FAD-binding and (Fe-S)-binding domain-containing protein [Vitreimonas sp.]|uniref:FAD-binding and (Fe-S)-binding domain-containing protein n=1 Tax=Vitreimonas sp. TaxID=3069702 RepID=UPI002D5D1C6F|nr:FAD-binding and (Fe-S)-binding domain-containing protein [Vitreimonas sp.]HYD89286.1 FAD-binding and (Fe-S)-binding domain-containing protein [Vitreimonas sp.]
MSEQAHRERERVASSGRVTAAYQAYPPNAVAGLERALKAGVRGEVDFSGGARALFATDASNYRQVPIGVVTPRDEADLVAAVAACCAHDAPVLLRGGGTALAGQSCNVAVVIDCSRWLDRVLDLDPKRRTARVQPGCVLDTLRDQAETHGLTFAPDPATHDHNTLGGMLGNNSCGAHSIMSGRTSDNVHRMDVLTYDGLRLDVGPTSDAELRAIIAAGGRRGEIYRKLAALRDKYGELVRKRFPKIPRRVSGFENLDALLPESDFNVARALVGTEGTCVAVLGATLQLVPSPPRRALAVLAFDDIFSAADAVPRVLEFGPIACEGMDDLLYGFVKTKHLHERGLQSFPEGRGWLLVEFGGDSLDEAAEKARRAIAAFGGRGRLVRDEHEQEEIWAVREAALGATAFVPDRPDTWEGWEDSAVHRENLGAYLRDLKALMHRHGYEAAFYGHFGDGLLHCRVNFDLGSEQGIANWSRFMREAADLAVRYDGSLSGEHGDGQARGELLERMYGPELIECFREFKTIWDPRNRMNPGKVVDPFPVTSNLRVGPSYEPPQVETHFRYPDDDGSFARATMRCVGVGKCRRLDVKDEVMCPSFLVTRDEKHSTRGRAHLLFEMLRGETLPEQWESDAVEEALSLCLACKGCKKDCPVEVDMATLKAEFRARYYARKLRPPEAYSMGFIYWWSRAAAIAPQAANAMLTAPGVAQLIKRAAGLAQDRRLPRYANRSFRDAFKRLPRPSTVGERVVLWPDTFNNFFRPQTALNAVEVLQRAGYEVVLPARSLCCGRPLYDWGFLRTAKRLWRKTLNTLRAEIEAGTPLIGLEPSCLAAFKDELPNLFPDNALARRLSENAVYFADFVEAHQDRFPAFAQGGEALLQVHCNHHAIIGAEGETRLLKAMQLDVRRPPAGCCGMAGAFGFSRHTADLSRQIAGRILTPAVREASEEVEILADGFSCREQIEQETGRETLHIADLLASRLPQS